MSFLPSDLYATIEHSIPIACVDFVPVDALTGEVGLILRESPFGRVWCHLGGRIRRGETIAGALRRHAEDTLGVGLELRADPQPSYVYQWFPPEISPEPGHGIDPRKHAIGLSFLVTIDGEPAPRNEALDFAWYSLTSLPEPIWPGSDTLLQRLHATS